MPSSISRLLAAFLTCTVWLLGTCARADEPLQADPALWGVYSQLIGTTRQAGERGYRVSWHWSRPGEEIDEQWSHPVSGKVIHTQRITLGDEPGELRSSIPDGKTWHGTIQPDGGVLMLGNGLIKQDHHVGIAEDGYFERRLAKVKNGRIISMAPAGQYARFALVDAPPTVTAGSPASIAAHQLKDTPGTPVSVQSAPVDPHADPAIWGDYARIVGRDWRGYYDVSVRWSVPGSEIVETWKYGPMRPSRDGQTIRTITLRPGDKPGRLRATVVGGNFQGEHKGKITKAGHVSFKSHSFKLVGPNTIDLLGGTVEGYYGAKLHAASPDTPEPQHATWGVYLDMIGQDMIGQSYLSDSSAGKVLMSFGWLVPSELLYELQHYLDQDYLFSQQIYVSPADGSLIAQSAPMWNRTGYGHVETDGTVRFATKGFFSGGQKWAFQRRGNGQFEYLADSALSAARNNVLTPVPSQEVAQIRMAARQRAEERERQEAVAKAERSERRAATLNALSGAMQAFNQEMSMYSATGGGSTNAQIEAAADRAIERVRSYQQQAAAQEVATAGAPSYASASAGAAAFASGVYVMDGGSYSARIERDGADLVVTESNKVSRYTAQSDGVWHFHDPNTGTGFGLRVIDGRTIEAFKPQQAGNVPTRLTLVGGGPMAVAQVKTASSNMNAIAERYKQQSMEDPGNTQVWVACSLAAHKRAMAPGAEADIYGAQMAQVLKQIMVDTSATPCADAIPADLW